MSTDPAPYPRGRSTLAAVRPEDARRWRRLSVVGTFGVLAMAVAVATMGGSIQAASSVPSGSSAAATPSPTPSPAPTLTMGPLVTLPPIGAPPVLSPVALADGYALGLATAPVTVDVWEDFQCPYCLRFTELVEPQVVSTYVESGKVRYVFHDLAFLGEESRWAAVAARLAEQQGRFWPFHDYLFANQLGENVGSFTLDRLQEVASAVGLDQAAFDAGLQMDAARATYAQIEQEARAGATALGIKATPTVLVDGVALSKLDFASIQAAVESALARAQASVAPLPGPATTPGAGSSGAAPSPAASAPNP
jgi:protein-disulfide isomerase